MERMSVSEASGHFDEVVDRVATEGITVELERNHRVVARLTPAEPSGKKAEGSVDLEVGKLNQTLSAAPLLGKEDAEAFARDIDKIRNDIPREPDPWD